jgi:epsin
MIPALASSTMARTSTGKALGKRTRYSTAEQQEHVEPARASKRLREKREANAGRNGATNSGRPTVRNGLATPEPSSLTESQTSPFKDPMPLAPKDIFPFMQLPAELRIHIYHMALHRAEPLLLHAARTDKDEEPARDGTCASSADFPIAPARRSRVPSPPPDSPTPLDPVVPTILRLNQHIYKEARSVLYSNNIFTLSLSSGIHTLSTLHQRSRSLIKHVILTIPSHHDILDGFADLVRLGLRYCWGLKTFKIIMQASLPDDGRMTHATSVYANAFHILRWLPRGCKVVLEGNVSEVVRDVVREEGRLQSVLDEVGYAKRQHQMPERH